MVATQNKMSLNTFIKSKYGNIYNKERMFFMKPELILIIKSEDNVLNGQTAKVIEMRSYKGEVDYRIETNGGERYWIPSENTSIIH